MMRNCCFRRRFSATSAFAPPGLRSLAIVARMWAKIRNRVIMAEELRWAGAQGQGEESLQFRVELLIRHGQDLCSGISQNISCENVVHWRQADRRVEKI